MKQCLQLAAAAEIKFVLFSLSQCNAHGLRAVVASLVLLPFALFAQQQPQQQPQAQHHISFPDGRNQYVNVRLRLPAESPQLQLIMPAWTPGSYLIRDFAAQLERLRATGASGKPLPVSKTAKNRWQVSVGNETEVIVDYAVWAGELAVNTSWVSAEYALLNGAGVFLYTERSRNWPQRVSVELPPQWQQVHTALQTGLKPFEFIASSYDELVDSPMLLGNPVEHPFEVAGQKYSLVNQGETSLWDGAESARDVAGIVEAIQSFWQVNPFDRPYLFLNIIAQGTGGLEHDHSTVLLASRWQMRYREDYVRWLALVSHEFFHAWSVRRMRPAALADYDYEREMYTRELWLAEGLTSYFDNLLLLRSGRISVDEFLMLLAAEFHKYETTPGRQVRSAEQASFDAWIKHYKPDANNINSDVSYYRKGSLIGFVLDQALRENTKGQTGLGELMREMYATYGPQGPAPDGYPAGAFEQLVEQHGGAELRQRLEQMLSSVDDPPIDAALAWYGLQLDRNPSKTAAEALGRPVPADFGLTWDKQSPWLQVETVARGSSGALAGILPADELLAINGTRVTRETIADRMLRLIPGETASLLLARQGQVLTLQVQAQEAIPDKYLINIRPDIKRRQKERMSAWLGVNLRFVNN